MMEMLKYHYLVHLKELGAIIGILRWYKLALLLYENTWPDNGYFMFQSKEESKIIATFIPNCFMLMSRISIDEHMHSMHTHVYTGEALRSHHTLHGEALCSPTLCIHKCTHHAF